MKKNEGGQVVAFQAVSATDGSAVTTGSPTVYVTIDGGTQASGTNTAIHEGQGVWSYVPTVAETNGDHIVYTFTLSGCINQSVNVYPVVVTEYQATGFSTFDHTSDEVTTDAASRTASQADVTGLATQASVDTVDSNVDAILVDTNDLQTNQGNWLTATGFNTVAPDNAGIAANGVAIANLNDFDPVNDTVAHVTLVDTTSVNTDMVGTDGALLAASAPTNWSIMAINVSGEITTSNPASGAGSAHTAEDVRDLILAGDKTPITMAVNKVSNVVLVDTTTTNTDMVGTDGANTVAPDNAGIAANGVAIANLNDFDPVSETVLVGDKTGFELSTAANEAIGTSFLAHVLTKGDAGTIERTFWQLAKTQTLADGEVSGTPTASAFDTNLTAVTGAYDHLLVVFVGGALDGEARPIESYSSVNGRITLQEPLTATPSATDEFIIIPDHSHTVSEIAIGVRNLILAGDQSPITMAGNKVSNVILVDTTTDLTNQSGSGNVTVEGFTNAALLEIVQTDTGVTVAGVGSVAKISQGAAGGNVTVGAFTQAALAEMVTTDTGETSATTGSVVQLSQSGATTGPGSYVYTASATVDGSPEADVKVWVTTDESGTNVIAGTLETDIAGEAVFTLEAGPFYLWRYKEGACFTNPEQITVEAP